MPERPRRRRVVILAVAAVACAALAVFAVRLAPWVSMPDEPPDRIQARWRDVVTLATVKSPPGPFDEERLAAAAASKALATFDEWAHARADVSPTTRVSSVSLYTLTRLALDASEDASSLERVEGCARIGAALRARGVLIDAAVGFTIAKNVAEWADRRGVALGAAFEPLRPRASEVRPALARDAVYAFGIVESSFPKDRSFMREQDPSGAGAWPPLGIVRVDRERLVYQKHHADFFDATAPFADDLQKIALAAEASQEHRPPSVVLTITQVTAASIVRNAAEAIATYDRLVPKVR